MVKKVFSRKLVKSNTSFIVTLPIGFINKFNLNKGDLLTIIENPDGSLKIIPDRQYEEAPDTIKLDFYPEIGKEILEKCLSGTKEIIITAERPITKKQKREIRYYVNKLPTTKLLPESPQKLSIQNFGVRDFPSEQILRGIFSNTLELFKNVKENEWDEKKENIEEIKELYMLFIQYIRTYLSKGFLHPKDYQGFNFKKASDYREIVNCIRDVAFILYDIDYYEEGLDYYNKIKDYFQETYDTFLFTHNRQQAYKLYFKNLWDEGAKLRDCSEGNLRYMIKDLLKIFHKISNILSIITILE